MNLKKSFVITCFSTIILGGCTNSQVGTVVGGAAGAGIGYAVSGNAVGTVIGAGAGSVIGHTLGVREDQRARRNYYYYY